MQIEWRSGAGSAAAAAATGVASAVCASVIAESGTRCENAAARWRPGGRLAPCVALGSVFVPLEALLRRRRARGRAGGPEWLRCCVHFSPCDACERYGSGLVGSRPGVVGVDRALRGGGARGDAAVRRGGREPAPRGRTHGRSDGRRHRREHGPRLRGREGAGAPRSARGDGVSQLGARPRGAGGGRARGAERRVGRGAGAGPRRCRQRSTVRRGVPRVGSSVARAREQRRDHAHGWNGSPGNRGRLRSHGAWGSWRGWVVGRPVSRWCSPDFPWMRAVRDEPPGSLPPDDALAGRARGEQAGARRHGVVDRAQPRVHSLGGRRLPQGADLRAVRSLRAEQAGERDVHARARPPRRGHGRDRRLPPPGRDSVRGRLETEAGEGEENGGKGTGTRGCWCASVAGRS